MSLPTKTSLPASCCAKDMFSLQAILAFIAPCTYFRSPEKQDIHDQIFRRMVKSDMLQLIRFIDLKTAGNKQTVHHNRGEEHGF